MTFMPLKLYTLFLLSQTFFDAVNPLRLTTYWNPKRNSNTTYQWCFASPANQPSTLLSVSKLFVPQFFNQTTSINGVKFYLNEDEENVSWRISILMVLVKYEPHLFVAFLSNSSRFYAIFYRKQVYVCKSFLLCTVCTKPSSPHLYKRTKT